MTEPPSEGAESSYTNIAQNNAQVDAQIGIVHGDVMFYKIAGEASPEEKYRVGRNYLDGNMPRQAEKLIREAFVAGHKLTEVSYYWALAVLSNRSFDHLAENEFDQLTDAFAEIERHDPDEWLTALGVVARLVQSLTIQEQQSDGDPENFDAALLLYGQLPAARKDEVRRHLEMVLVGGIQDQLEAQDAAEIAQKRMGNDRRNRVSKFFEQKPVPARRLAPPDGEPQAKDVATLVGGVALGLLCLYFGGRFLLGGSVLLFAVALLLYLGGAYLVVRYGLERRALEARLRWADSRFHGRPWTARGNNSQSRSDWQQKIDRFATDIGRLLELRFAGHQPEDERLRNTWATESAGIRATLEREIVEQYAELNPLPPVGAIDWLIRWHADSIFTSWKNETLYDYRGQLKVSKEMVTGSILGVIALGMSVLLSAANAVGVAPILGLLTAAGWCAASILVWQGGAAVHKNSTLATYWSSESQRRLLEENKAFADWQEALADRPTDAEMAVWLDFDKAHIKATAMKQYGLANRDLIAHVVLTGPASVCYGARVLYGPPRYSDYDVQLFLLTDAGVRQVSVQLHLATGAITNERRRSFRYDAISSAEVAEVGVRIDGSRKEVVRSNEEAKSRRANSEKLVFSQEFTLTLNSMQAVHVMVGNCDQGLIDRVLEDAKYLFELARDTSGVTAALRILEAIAAEGNDWVKQERLRRRRRIMDYQRKRNALHALEKAPNVPTPRIGDKKVLPELE